MGIELDTTIDTGTDGTFDGERYFECKDGKGTFVKTTRIKRKLAMSTRPKPKTPKTPKTPKQGLDDKKEDENKPRCRNPSSLRAASTSSSSSDSPSSTTTTRTTTTRTTTTTTRCRRWKRRTSPRWRRSTDHRPQDRRARITRGCTLDDDDDDEENDAFFVNPMKQSTLTLTALIFDAEFVDFVLILARTRALCLF